MAARVPVVVAAVVVAAVGVSVVDGCANVDARADAERCARARLARQFPTTPSVRGRCYRTDSGPAVLVGAGTVVFSDVVDEAPVDEAVRYLLGTERAVVTATRLAPASQSWEQLAPDVVRLVFAEGTSALEVCADVDTAGVIDGAVFVVDDTPPFAHPRGRVHLTPVACPH